MAPDKTALTGSAGAHRLGNEVADRLAKLSAEFQPQALGQERGNNMSRVAGTVVPVLLDGSDHFRHDLLPVLVDRSQGFEQPDPLCIGRPVGVEQPD